MLKGLFFIEFLCSEDVLESNVLYFRKLGLFVTKIDKLGLQYLLTTPGTSIKIILRVADTSTEKETTARHGTTVIDLAFLCDKESFFKMDEKEEELGHRRSIQSPIPGLQHTVILDEFKERVFEDWVDQEERPLGESFLPEYEFVDHITIACRLGETNAIVNWYENMFSLVNKTGATIIKSFGGGLRLLSLWHPDEHGNETFVKLTFVEPLLCRNPEKLNQVTTFLKEHQGPGVQHIAFHCKNIVEACEGLAKNGISFVPAPSRYYDAKEKVSQIKSAGLDGERLRKVGLLLDGNPGRSYGYDGVQPGHLLQIFTKPSFERATFFFEVIFRGSDSHGNQVKGFGAGNIRDLFRAVASMTKIGLHRNISSVLGATSFDEVYEKLQKKCANIFKRTSDYSFYGQRRSPKVSVVIVGGGLCGLSAALALSQKDVDVLVLEKTAKLPPGTRAISWTKSTLEFWSSLGITDKILKFSRKVQKRVLMWREKEIEEDAGGHSQLLDLRNIPQYVIHYALLKRLSQQRNCTLLFGTKVVSIGDVLRKDGSMVQFESPSGVGSAVSEFVVDCSGSHSVWRSHLVDADFKDERKFLITDIILEGTDIKVPQHRLFWMSPPFHEEGDTFLLQPQHGGYVRMDFSFKENMDSALILSRSKFFVERALQYLAKANVLSYQSFRQCWSSSYMWRNSCLRKAVEGRLIFAGDSLKVVSPFGARGGNEGVRDIASLCWRLQEILKNSPNLPLLMDYSNERCLASHQDVAINRITMNFIDPPQKMRFLVDAVLRGLDDGKSVKGIVNTGRFPFPPPSVRQAVRDYSEGSFEATSLQPGDYYQDLELGNGQGCLASKLPSYSFCTIAFGVSDCELENQVVRYISEASFTECLRQFYDPPSIYIFRPDLVVMARFKSRRALLDFLRSSSLERTSCELISTPRQRVPEKACSSNTFISEIEEKYCRLYNLLLKCENSVSQMSVIADLLTKANLPVPKSQSLSDFADAILDAIFHKNFKF